MLEGAIFDLDGTLLDSMYVWNDLGENYLRSLDIKPKKNLNKALEAMNLYQAACYFKSEYKVNLSAEEIIDGINKMIDSYYAHEVEPKQGVVSFLEALHSNGVKMCIATATDRYMVEAALKRCGINHFFSEIFTCFSVGFGKDNPKIYREALKHLSTEKAKTVVFEDAEYALKTAKADGFLTAAVYDRYEKNQKSIKRLADFYIADYSDMNKFFRFAEKL